MLDKKDLEAPIAANQRVGEISLYDGDKVVGHYPRSPSKASIKAECSRGAITCITSCNHANRLFAGGFFHLSFVLAGRLFYSSVVATL